jgi:hypothetical protein
MVGNRDRVPRKSTWLLMGWRTGKSRIHPRRDQIAGGSKNADRWSASENPLRPVETYRGSLRRGGTRMVGEMRKNTQVDRISPERPSKDGVRSSRVAQSLNFIVMPWMIGVVLSTDDKRPRLTNFGKNVGED